VWIPSAGFIENGGAPGVMSVATANWDKGIIMRPLPRLAGGDGLARRWPLSSDCTAAVLFCSRPDGLTTSPRDRIIAQQEVFVGHFSNAPRSRLRSQPREFASIIGMRWHAKHCVCTTGRRFPRSNFSENCNPDSLEIFACFIRKISNEAGGIRRIM